LCQYPEIWAIDAVDPLVGPEGGESVADVAIRVSEAIVQIETEVQGFVFFFS
jgi:broad specificity phosphatase PhoE